MRELTYKTLGSLAKPLRYICVAGKKVVTIADGWNITGVTIGSDNEGTRRRLIITVDKD